MNNGTKSNLRSTIFILLTICILELISHWMSGSEKPDSNNHFLRFELVRALGPILIFLIVSFIYYWFISDPTDFKKSLLIAILALCIVIKLFLVFFSNEGLEGVGHFILIKIPLYVDMLAQLLRIYVIYRILQISDR
jgi:hypothetical protein